MTNKGRYWEYKAISFLIYIIPLLVLFALQPNHYVKSAGTSVSFFGYIILALIMIAFKDKFLEFVKKNAVLSVSLIIFITSLIMRYLADELMVISGVSLFGALLSTVVEPVADVYHARAEKEKIGEGTGEVLSHKNAWRLAYGFREKQSE